MESVLKLNGVGLEFGDHEVLSGVGFEVERGDFVVLLGSNGSGKSSLLKVIAGVYKKSRGEIEYGVGRGEVMLIGQEARQNLFLEMSVLENFKLWDREGRGEGFYEECLREVNEELVGKMGVRVEKLSGGQKQALVLGLLKVRPPRVLLLDEHTSALDPRTGGGIMEKTHELVVKHGMTCMMVSHDLEHAVDYGNKLMILKRGKIEAYMAKGDFNGGRLDVDYLKALSY